MKSAIVVATLVVLAGGLAACGGDQGSVAQPTTTLPAAPAAPAAPPAPGTELTDTQQSNGGIQNPGTEPAGVPDAGAAAPNDAPSPAPPDLPSRPGATVDARNYQQRDSVYFQSPSGNINCGFLVSGPAGVGCQLAHANVIPPQLPNCSDADDRKVAVHADYAIGSKSTFRCNSQGVYVGESVDGTLRGGGAILHYGDTINVRGDTCTSTEQGVRCVVGGDHGFTISADSQTLF